MLRCPGLGVAGGDVKGRSKGKGKGGDERLAIADMTCAQQLLLVRSQRLERCVMSSHNAQVKQVHPRRNSSAGFWRGGGSVSSCE